MPEYNISEIAKILGKPFTGDDRPVRFLLTDSRRIISPGNTVFFALEGKRQNGHDYIRELYDKGVKAFIVSDTVKELLAGSCEAAVIKVNNTLEALQAIAGHNRNIFRKPVIGIAGSNGKTIVKEWLFQCLSKDRSISRSPKSYNSQIGVPLSVWLLETENDIGIFEAGISQPGDGA